MVLHLGNNDDKKTSSTLHRGESISVNVKRIWMQSISIHFWEVNMENISTSKFKNKKQPKQKVKKTKHTIDN